MGVLERRREGESVGECLSIKRERERERERENGSVQTWNSATREA